MPPKKQAKELREMKEQMELLMQELQELKQAKASSSKVEEWKNPFVGEEASEEGTSSKAGEELESIQGTEEEEFEKGKWAREFLVKAKIELDNYAGSLKADELMDWLLSLEQFFDIQGIEDPKCILFAVTKLKGHAALWWANLQRQRRAQGEGRMKTWKSFVEAIKQKFLPKDYEQQLYKEFQNLKQGWDQTVAQYMDNFYRLSIRLDVQEDENKLAMKFVNGLKFNIQQELQLFPIVTVEEGYQMALKVEEKLSRQGRRNANQIRGRGGRFGTSPRGRGQERQQGSSSRHEVMNGSKHEEEKTRSTQGEQSLNRGRGFGRGYARGRGGRFQFNNQGPRNAQETCYRCGGLGHRSYECTAEITVQRGHGRGMANALQPHPRIEELTPEIEGDQVKNNLMLRRVCGKVEPQEAMERRQVF